MSHQYDVDEERKNRFLSTGADTPRSASQPPTTNGDGFYSAAAMQIYGSPGGHTGASLNNSASSPWAISAGRLPALSRSVSIGAPASAPRAASFSARDYAGGSFASAIRESHSFPSTFEDDESEAMSDAGGPTSAADSLAYSYSYGEPRGRAIYGADARSRSQSLAAASAPRPGPVGSPPASGGWAYGSGPLSIPGRYGDIKPPTSRYGSLGGRLAGGMSPSPTGLRPGGYGHAELTNISPLARDVGQILLDEDSWALNGGESGTTSRRHSVSIVQPRRGIIGFNAPEHQDDHRGGQSYNYGGASAGSASAGGLAISDDELAGLTSSMLNLNSFSSSNEMPPSQPSSLPIYAPLSRPSASSSSDMENLSVHLPGDHSGIPRHMLRSPSESNQSASSGGGSNSSPTRTAEHSLSPHPQDPSPVAGYAPGQLPQRPRPSEIRTDMSPQALHAHLSAAQLQQYQLQQAQARFASEQGFGYGAPPSPTLVRSAIAPNQSFMMQAQAHASPLSPLSPGHAQAPVMGRQRSLSQVAQGIGAPEPASAGSDMGRGIPLHAVPQSWALYIVEFKAGRTDLFYVADLSHLTGIPPGSGPSALRVGDLVIVEADRGRDLGKIVNDTITAAEVEAFQRTQLAAAQSNAAYGDHGGPVSPDGPAPPPHGKREISPKKIYGKATAQDAQ